MQNEASLLFETPPATPTANFDGDDTAKFKPDGCTRAATETDSERNVNDETGPNQRQSLTYASGSGASQTIATKARSSYDNPRIKPPSPYPDDSDSEDNGEDDCEDDEGIYEEDGGETTVLSNSSSILQELISDFAINLSLESSRSDKTHDHTRTQTGIEDKAYSLVMNEVSSLIGRGLPQSLNHGFETTIYLGQPRLRQMSIIPRSHPLFGRKWFLRSQLCLQPCPPCLVDAIQRFTFSASRGFPTVAPAVRQAFGQ
ncbi:hypothetical protein BGZ83_009841 [Gryganskiella cystojenkinii]|nr:hypothetical protein BGZ83_009841 [Gryganskiella cystojenkinii]